MVNTRSYNSPPYGLPTRLLTGLALILLAQPQTTSGEISIGPIVIAVKGILVDSLLSCYCISRQRSVSEPGEGERCRLAHSGVLVKVVGLADATR